MGRPFKIPSTEPPAKPDWQKIFKYKQGNLWRIHPINQHRWPGWVDLSGHVVFEENKVRYFMCRVIYELHHGDIHEGFEVYHINGNKLDNRIENLMLSEVKQLRPSKRSTVGYGGVYKSKYNTFIARLRHGKKSYSLGTFKTAEEAAEAVFNKKIELDKIHEDSKNLNGLGGNSGKGVGCDNRGDDVLEVR